MFRRNNLPNISEEDVDKHPIKQLFPGIDFAEEGQFNPDTDTPKLVN